ncbi:hypothetical protein HK099_000336, partial [Clydaea vesicula]
MEVENSEQLKEQIQKLKDENQSFQEKLDHLKTEFDKEVSLKDTALKEKLIFGKEINNLDKELKKLNDVIQKDKKKESLQKALEENYKMKAELELQSMLQIRNQSLQDNIRHLVTQTDEIRKDLEEKLKIALQERVAKETPTDTDEKIKILTEKLEKVEFELREKTSENLKLDLELKSAKIEIDELKFRVEKSEKRALEKAGSNAQIDKQQPTAPVTTAAALPAITQAKKWWGGYSKSEAPVTTNTTTVHPPNNSQEPNIPTSTTTTTSVSITQSVTTNPVVDSNVLLSVEVLTKEKEEIQKKLAEVTKSKLNLEEELNLTKVQLDTAKQLFVKSEEERLSIASANNTANTVLITPSTEEKGKNSKEMEDLVKENVVLCSKLEELQTINFNLQAELTSTKQQNAIVKDETVNTEETANTAKSREYDNLEKEKVALHEKLVEVNKVKVSLEEELNLTRVQLDSAKQIVILAEEEKLNIVRQNAACGEQVQDCIKQLDNVVNEKNKLQNELNTTRELVETTKITASLVEEEKAKIIKDYDEMMNNLKNEFNIKFAEVDRIKASVEEELNLTKVKLESAEKNLSKPEEPQATFATNSESNSTQENENIKVSHNSDILTLELENLKDKLDVISKFNTNLEAELRETKEKLQLAMQTSVEEQNHSVQEGNNSIQNTTFKLKKSDLLHKLEVEIKQRQKLQTELQEYLEKNTGLDKNKEDVIAAESKFVEMLQNEITLLKKQSNNDESHNFENEIKKLKDEIEKLNSEFSIKEQNYNSEKFKLEEICIKSLEDKAEEHRLAIKNLVTEYENKLSLFKNESENKIQELLVSKTDEIANLKEKNAADIDSLQQKFDLEKTEFQNNSEKQLKMLEQQVNLSSSNTVETEMIIKQVKLDHENFLLEKEKIFEEKLSAMAKTLSEKEEELLKTKNELTKKAKIREEEIAESVKTINETKKELDTLLKKSKQDKEAHSIFNQNLQEQISGLHDEKNNISKKLKAEFDEKLKKEKIELEERLKKERFDNDEKIKKEKFENEEKYKKEKAKLVTDCEKLKKDLNNIEQLSKDQIKKLEKDLSLKNEEVTKNVNSIKIIEAELEKVKKHLEDSKKQHCLELEKKTAELEKNIKEKESQNALLETKAQEDKAEIEDLKASLTVINEEILVNKASYERQSKNLHEKEENLKKLKYVEDELKQKEKNFQKFLKEKESLTKELENFKILIKEKDDVINENEVKLKNLSENEIGKVIELQKVIENIKEENTKVLKINSELESEFKISERKNHQIIKDLQKQLSKERKTNFSYTDDDHTENQRSSLVPENFKRDRMESNSAFKNERMSDDLVHLAQENETLVVKVKQKEHDLKIQGEKLLKINEELESKSKILQQYILQSYSPKLQPETKPVFNVNILSNYNAMQKMDPALLSQINMKLQKLIEELTVKTLKLEEDLKNKE